MLEPEAAASLAAQLLEAAPDPMVVVDARGAIVLVNGQLERVFGYRRSELLGQPLELLIPERLRGGHAQHLARYLAAPRARPMGAGLDLSGRRRDGTVFPVEISLSPMQGPDGLLVTAAIRDITERRRAEEAVRALNRELEAFSYSISHDLRTPLRAIDGFSHVLQDDYGDRLDATALDHLQRIRTASQRMGALIDDLLRLARITRGELRPAAVDLTALAGEVAAELQEQEPGRAVRWEIAPGLQARGDARLLRIALQDLMGNAWRFTRGRDPAVIAVGGGALGGEQVVYVKDNGMGFDMAHAARLFQPFQKLHRAPELEGAGVGLATVQRIAEKHGGRAWAEATPDAGATFYLGLGAAPGSAST